MKCVLGVDGGATKTQALLLDFEGYVLGYGEGGCANHQVCGLEAALREIVRASEQAVSALSTGHSPQVGCFCLAGADFPEDFEMLQKALTRVGLVQEVIIKNDTMAALRSGLSSAWGVVVVCGTGFNAAGRAPDGREVRLPGLGIISGDWGGGYDLAMEVIRQVMRAWDGRGRPTLLTARVLESLNEPSEESLLRSLYHQRISTGQLLGLVPILFEVAEQGDAVARDILVRLGKEIGITANAILRRLSLDQEAAEVVLAGGVFKGRGRLLLDTVTRVVHKQTPRARVVRPRFEPVVGAALLALEIAGVPVTWEIMRHLEASLPANLWIGR